MSILFRQKKNSTIMAVELTFNTNELEYFRAKLSALNQII